MITDFLQIKQRIFFLILAGLISSDASGQSHLSDVVLNGDEIKIFYEKDKTSGYRILDAVAIIEAEPREILGVIVDYKHFSEFMPRIKSTEVYYQATDSVFYLANVEMPWPLDNIWYKLAVSIDTVENRTKWRMISGSILDTKGSWTLTKHPNGTRVVYHVEALLDSSFPEFAIAIAQKKTVNDIIKAVRKRLRSINKSR